MKYETEYQKTQTRDEFVKLVLKKNPQLNPDSPRRFFYKLRSRYRPQKSTKLPKPQKKLPTEFKLVYEKTVLFKPQNLDLPEKEPVDGIEQDTELTAPPQTKLLMLDDMKRLGYTINYQFLKQHGFTRPEIEWLRRQKNGIG